MPTDRRDVVTDAPGIEEVAVVPWPLLVRRRVEHRVQGSDRYPWLVLGAALFGLFSVGFSITVLTVAVRLATVVDARVGGLLWVVTGALLLGAVVAPAAGRLVALYCGPRLFFVAVFCGAVFAGLAAVAWDAGSLIAFRVLGAA